MRSPGSCDPQHGIGRRCVVAFGVSASIQFLQTINDWAPVKAHLRAPFWLVPTICTPAAASFNISALRFSAARSSESRSGMKVLTTPEPPSTRGRERATSRTPLHSGVNMEQVNRTSGSSAIAGFRPHGSHRAALPPWALHRGSYAPVRSTGSSMAGPDGRAEQGVPGGGFAGFLVTPDADEQALGHSGLAMDPRLWSLQQPATTPLI